MSFKSSIHKSRTPKSSKKRYLENVKKILGQHIEEERNPIWLVKQHSHRYIAIDYTY
jgi:hypothetical protein